MKSNNRHQFILSELGKISYKEKNGEALVLCPFHTDSNPSFTICMDPSKPVPLGWGRCWACGANHPWNEFSEKLGMRKFSKTDEMFDVGFAIRKRRDSDPLAEDDAFDIETLMEKMELGLAEPVGQTAEKWRGFDPEFLSQFECMVGLDKFDNQVLMIPVKVDGEFVGGTLARWSKEKTVKKIPSYIHMKGSWSKKKGLFPYDHVDKMLLDNDWTHVVLCEGVRDAMRFIREGIPALCIFGTQTWSKEKEQLLQALGIDTIFICMDAGEAGIASTNKILKSTKGEFKRIALRMNKYQKKYEKKKKIKFGKEMDAFNCPPSVMRYMKKIIDRNT